MATICAKTSEFQAPSVILIRSVIRLGSNSCSSAVFPLIFNERECVPGAMDEAFGLATAALKKLSADATTPAALRSWAISAPVAPVGIDTETLFSVFEITRSGKFGYPPPA